VNRFLFLVFFQLLFVVFSFAQQVIDTSGISGNDSVSVIYPATGKDSFEKTPRSDSVYKRPNNKLTWALNPGVPLSTSYIRQQILLHHPYYNFKGIPLNIHSDIKEFQSNDLLFYVFVSLFLIYALLKRSFPKYFNDLYRLFFRTTLKQIQIKEQLMQNPLPSLLMNIFFVISGGMYTSFCLEYLQLIAEDSFWEFSIYSFIGLSVIYVFKYLGIWLSGWIFNLKEAADSYIFIVFIINKMIGVALLPFLVLLAYTKGNVYLVSFTLSLMIVAGLLTYRFVLTYGIVRKQIKVNPFHFFLYLCAFEIAPLLLIYKGLLLFFHITA